MGKVIDLTGRKVWRWTVLSYHGKVEGQKQPFWLCRCDCGTERLVAGPSLRTEASKSCGCHRSDSSRYRATRHGMANTKLNRVWSGMKARCTNKNHIGYPIYGGRGIKVCERWQLFANFFVDMGASYKPGLTLDRIDTNGDYEPENCRWATYEEQAENKRKPLIIVETPGGAMKIGTAEKTYGVNRRTILHWHKQNVLMQKLTAMHSIL